VVPVGGALPPSIYSVGQDTNPVFAGTSVTLGAINTGTGGDATSFSWDFGGAASPNTSTEATPKLNVATPGVVHGLVTASNAVGSSTVAFDLTVIQPAAPNLTAITGNAPQTGIAQSIGVQNTGGMGNVWAWDFGGACSPNTSDVIGPMITPLAAGT